jgi:hypothetical protein
MRHAHPDRYAAKYQGVSGAEFNWRRDCGPDVWLGTAHGRR